MRTKLVIEEAAESKQLTVLDTVKLELGITSDEHDERLQALIASASDVVAGYCDRVFARETVTETFWPEHWRCLERWDALVLARTPIEEIISVTHDEVLLAATDYEFDQQNGTLWRLAPAPWPFHWSLFNKVAVTYTGGYLLLDGLPSGVERAAILLCKEYFFQGSRDPRIKTESTPGIYSVDYWVGSTGQSGELPPDVIALLAPY